MTGSREESTPRSHDGDELDSLVVPGAATASHSDAHADDDVIDLRALTKLSASARPSAAEPEPEPQSQSAAVNAPRLEELAAVHVPAPRHASTAWLLPLIIGFAAGMPAGAWLLGGRSVTPPTAVAAPTPTLPPTAAQAPSVELAAPAEHAEAERPQGAPTADAERERVKPLPSAEPSVPMALAVVRAGSAAPEPRRSVDTPESSAAAAPPQAASAPSTADSASQAPVLSLTKLEPADPVEAAFPEVKSGEAPSAAPKSMNDLLDDAIAGAPRPTSAPESQAFAAAEAPLAPSRQDVSDTMAVLVPAIRGCAMGQAGLATAGLVVQSDGKVASVKVTGAPFEGAASGRCMEGVLRRARFPRFRQSVFRVQFPFAIQ